MSRMPASENPFSVTGRKVVVVGGTAGIGWAAAEYLSEAGAEVVVTGRRASGLPSATGIGSLPMDISSQESVAEGFASLGKSLGSIDCLVLNAGIDIDTGTIDSLDLGAFERLIDVNLVGLVRAMSAGVSLLGPGGSVVVTSSPAGSLAVPGMSAYASSKAALDMLVKVWAVELGPRGIRVNALLPGIVVSEMDSESAPDTEVIRRMTANGVHREASELGPVFQFLAADASQTLTGSMVGAHDGISVGLSVEMMERLSVGR